MRVVHRCWRDETDVIAIDVYWDVRINEWGGVDLVPLDGDGYEILSNDPALLSITPSGRIVILKHEPEELEAIGVKPTTGDESV